MNGRPFGKPAPPPTGFELCERAIREGRHAPTPRMCDGCREWVDAVYHRTLDGKDLCRRCGGKAGYCEACLYAIRGPVVVDAAGRHLCRPCDEKAKQQTRGVA